MVITSLSCPVNMDSKASLSPMDMFLLSDASQIKVLCKDHAFDDISEAILGEVMRLRLADFFTHNKVLETYEMNKNHSHVQSSLDSRCWLTPSICQDHNLKGIGELVKRLINTCGPMKTSQNLIEKYIVKLTVNVSMFCVVSYVFLTLQHDFDNVSLLMPPPKYAQQRIRHAHSKEISQSQSLSSSRTTTSCALCSF